MHTKNSNDNITFEFTTSDNDIEQENYILKETLNQMKEELKKFKRLPLMVCEVYEIIGKKAIIKIPNGNNFFVEISKECNNIDIGDSVLVEQKNLTVIKKITNTKNHNVGKFVIIKNPDITWKNIGGLDEQINEIKEVIELPLKKPELFKEVGIQPPKGILLHGEPGTGKTLLAKAVAASTNSTFIEVVGSELVQKFIGEGAKLVKEIFQIAKEKAPSIIFIDELDALAARRVDVGTSGEREVQRTFMQLLSEIDGFKHLENVKIIGCTNRKDILDPAILRPGRLDRLIKVGIPNIDARKTIFKIHTKDMTLDKNINLKKVIDITHEFTGAEIRAVCTEAGYFAIRKNRSIILEEDLINAVEKVKRREELEGTDYIKMFG